MKRQRRRRLAFEGLECRALLSADNRPFDALAVFGPSESESDLLNRFRHVLEPVDALGNYGSATPPSAAFTPSQFRIAYGINLISDGGISMDGTGMTVAIIDAFDNPKFVSRNNNANVNQDPSFLASDLHKFDLQYGLPEPAGFFTKIDQRGGTSYPQTDAGWGTEIALDVEWVHAVAPGAKIILVEADSNSDTNLIENAGAWARDNSGAVAISMSFGRDETASNLDSVFHSPADHGIVWLASTGDDGAPGGYPAYAPSVVAVGGTKLVAPSGTYSSENGWSGSGGGISSFEAQPAYQQNLVIHDGTSIVNPAGKRSIPDISLDADPSSGVAVYDSFAQGTSTPWIQVGGTSLSSPTWAGLVVIMDQIRARHGKSSLDGLTGLLPQLYKPTFANDYHDITSGFNGFGAGLGYDLVTGIGTPKANTLFPKLAGTVLTIDSSVPSTGAVVSTPPTSFTVDFSDPIDAATVNASDLTVNSIVANSVSVSADNLSATFTYNSSPVTNEGLQTMTMAAGAVKRLGDVTIGNSVFSTTFRYDVVLLQVASTNPSAGATLNLPGPFTYDVTFNEVFNPATVQATDLVLSGVSGATVSGVSILAGNLTAEFTISGATSDGQITVNIPAGAITDPFGNPGAAYSANLFTDSNGPMPFPSFSAQSPFGSLIYNRSITGGIGSGDTDIYTLAVDPGQTISVLATASGSGLQPSIQLLDPNGGVIGSATAGGAGQNALLQTAAAAATSGTYQIVISGAGASTGGYGLQLTLNAALESEGVLLGVDNDSLASAQTLDSSVILLAGDASRMAVSGLVSSGTDQDNYSVTMIGGEMASFTAAGLGLGTVNLEVRDGSGALLATSISGAAKGTSVINNFVFQTSGTYFVRVSGAANTAYSLVIVRNGILEDESNDTSAKAQDIKGMPNALGSISAGATQIVNAVDAGTWDSTGFHRATDKSYIVGLNSGVRTYAYFVFDLGNVSQAISAAQVNLLNPVGGYSSGDSTETLSIQGVSTAISSLEASGSSQSGIAFDLSFGTSYGTKAVSASNNGQIVPVTLSASGVTALNNKLGSQIAFAGNLTTVSGTSNQYVFGGSGASDAKQLLLTFSDSADWYSFDVSSTSNAIQVQTSTPADGPGQFSNSLNPHIDLFDPAGNLVASGIALADGRNELLQYQPQTTGTFKVKVTAESGTAGDYALSVVGNTTTRPFQVATTNLANGALVRVAPTSVTLDFNDLILQTSLAASDVKVDGVSATSLTVVDGNTITLGLPGPFADGVHAITIAAGDIADIQGTPIAAYSSSFTFDTIGPRVIATSIAPGGTTLPGVLNYQVTFSEPILRSKLSSGTFSLHAAIAGADYTFSPSFDATSTVMTLTQFEGTIYPTYFPEDIYTLTLVSAVNGAGFSDLAGNPLDGEFTGILPTGDGVPGGNFVVTFSMDLPSEALPVPLVPVQPLGSLIYSRPIKRSVDVAGDSDAFTFTADPGQTVTVLVSSNSSLLQPTVQLLDSGNTVLASATAAGPGKNALLQAVPTSNTSGAYQIVVGGSGLTTGIYTLQITLNAALENEGILTGVDNDTLAAAQDIDSTGILLTGQSSRHLAINGTSSVGNHGVSEDFETGSLPSSFTTYSSPFGQVQIAVPGGTGNSSAFALLMKSSVPGFNINSLNEAVQTVDLTGVSQATLTFSHIKFSDSADSLPAVFTGHVNGDGVAISGDGTTWHTLFNASSTDTTWTSTSIDLSAAAAAAGLTLGPNFKIKYQEYGSNTGRGFDDISISTPEKDYYRFTLNAGGSATVSVTNQTTGNLQVELRDDNDVVLATGATGTTAFTRVINNFKATTSGHYFLVVTGTFKVPYSAIVTINSAFDVGNNESFATAQDINGNPGVLGSAQSSLSNVTVGYFTDGNPSSTGPQAPILQVGFTPIRIADISTFNLNSIDILMIDDSDDSESAYSAALLGRMSDIQSWVQTGGVLVANDGLIFEPTVNLFLFGDPDALTLHGNFDSLQATPPGNTLVTNGPFGTITQLNAGSYAAGGFVKAWTLPFESTPILNRSGGPSDVVAFSYHFGHGAVYYSTIPLDRFLDDTSDLGFKTVYAPNMLAYANSLLPANDEDWYSINVASRESTIRLETTTPGDGQGEFLNPLDPHLELYDPSGNLMTSGAALSDGRNEFIEYQPLIVGTYRIRVTAEPLSAGEYYLSVKSTLLGDLNQDGIRSIDDLATLLSALTDLSSYQAQRGFSDSDVLAVADVNSDGAVNNADIQRLIDLLIHPPMNSQQSNVADHKGPVDDIGMVPMLAASSTGSIVAEASVQTSGDDGHNSITVFGSDTYISPLRAATQPGLNDISSTIAGIDERSVDKPAASSPGSISQSVAGRVQPSTGSPPLVGYHDDEFALSATTESRGAANFGPAIDDAIAELKLEPLTSSWFDTAGQVQSLPSIRNRMYSMTGDQYLPNDDIAFSTEPLIVIHPRMRFVGRASFISSSSATVTKDEFFEHFELIGTHDDLGGLLGDF